MADGFYEKNVGTVGLFIYAGSRKESNCRACELLRKSEKEYIRTFAGMIEEPDGQKQYRQSQGVCLRYLGMLLESVTIDGSREYLLAHAAQRFEEDAEDMRRFAMKTRLSAGDCKTAMKRARTGGPLSVSLYALLGRWTGKCDMRGI